MATTRGKPRQFSAVPSEWHCEEVENIRHLCAADLWTAGRCNFRQDCPLCRIRLISAYHRTAAVQRSWDASAPARTAFFSWCDSVPGCFTR